MRTRLLTCLAAAAALGLVGCADAGDPEPTPTPGATAPATPTPSGDPTPAAVGAASLTVTVDETGSGATTTLTLTCDPAGGDHPDPEGACAALAAVGTAGLAETPPDVMCTQQWGGPQVATVEGTVDGAPVSARFSLTDGCEIARWDALVPLLPAAGGGM
ncbi:MULTISPECIES: SSI family serine proteinase inhibitor [unclassified Actinotalea]|uniref:SSI family serine proteinase inhibitor n=1 Tax=unclassified Actinotalea TaxID=2638618 RepID=UPI0015F4C8DC|nr:MULTISPECIES: SSI family serine proteinase inhibitor [unclassified Actinotalea]